MDELFGISLPPIDRDHFMDRYVIRHGEEFGQDDPDYFTVEECRYDYFLDAVNCGLKIRELQEQVETTRDSKKKDKAERELERALYGFPAYLIETWNFFQVASAEALEKILEAETGFRFDKGFGLLPDSIHRRNFTEMTAKAATKTAPKKSKPVVGIRNSIPSEEDEVNTGRARATELVPLEKITVSPFEPQQRRRKRFTDEEIKSLSESIALHGLIQAVVLRPVPKKGKTEFEIVAGERRFLGVQLLGWKEIPSSVKELTDEAAFDIQMHENLDRKDPHPIDEAFSYKFLRDKFGYDLDGVALHVGRPATYVAQRLKLLALHQEALSSFEKGEILFGHALEIAKYPKDSQMALLELAFTDRDRRLSGILSVPKFLERIDQDFHRRLTKAPFPIADVNLRPDGLTCKNCAERTGADALLFEDGAGKKDSCLNPKCWNGKTQAFIQIQRIDAALGSFTPGLELSKEEQKQIDAVPLISAEYIYRDDPRPAQYIGNHDYDELKKPDECKKAVTGVFFNGNRVGQKVNICYDKTCSKHRGRYASSSSRTKGAAATEAEQDLRRQRKEEIIDCKVGEAVRLEVLKQAAAEYDETNSIFNKQIPAFGTFKQGPSLVKDELVSRLWYLQCREESQHARNILSILKLTPEKLKPSAYQSNDDGQNDQTKIAEQVAALDEDIKAKLLFLLLTAWRNPILGDRYKFQAQIKKLASHYGINYDLVDARQRVVLAEASMKKHLDKFKQHLNAVESGKKSSIPRVYSENYK